MASLKLALRFFAAMLPYMALALPFTLAARLLRQQRLRRQGYERNLWHEAGLIIFILLLCGLASQAILPQLALTDTGWQLAPGGWNGLNLRPLEIFRDSYRQAQRHGNLIYFFINFIGNLGVFLPFGLFLPLLWEKIGLKRVALTGFLASLLIELCQLPQNRGTDIDDLWLNTLGAVLGYALYRLLERPFGSFLARFKLRKAQS